MLFDGLSFRFLPGTCLLCGARSRRALDLCAACEAELPRLGTACLRCAMPLSRTGDHCGACRQRPPPQDAVHAPFRYAWPLDALIQRFKFNNDQAAGRVLGGLFAHAVSQLARPAVLLPVPLHVSRLRQRGFNQAELLARALAQALRVPLQAGWLERARATAVQSGMDAVARRRNVRGAFLLRAQAWPAHVAVVDDVVTTGSTVGEIARLLKRAGVQRVSVWALARTLRY